jgi:hypothetical protein
MINSMEKKKTELTENQLLIENEELRQCLYEYEETLNSIRNGEIDAIVVSGVDGEKIYSLTSAETKYRIIIEEMNEGAITTSRDGLHIAMPGLLNLFLNPQKHWWAPIL